MGRNGNIVLIDPIRLSTDTIQQQTELKNSPLQQPHTFAISLNAIPQTQKLQKNVDAQPKKEKKSPKKTKYFWYVV